MRVATAKNFCKGFLLVDWSEPKELRGVGTLGNDSWRLFCGWSEGPAWQQLDIADCTVRKYQLWLKHEHSRLGSGLHNHPPQSMDGLECESSNQKTTKRRSREASKSSSRVGGKSLSAVPTGAMQCSKLSPTNDQSKASTALKYCASASGRVLRARKCRHEQEEMANRGKNVQEVRKSAKMQRERNCKVAKQAGNPPKPRHKSNTARRKISPGKKGALTSGKMTSPRRPPGLQRNSNRKASAGQKKPLRRSMVGKMASPSQRTSGLKSRDSDSSIQKHGRSITVVARHSQAGRGSVLRVTRSVVRRFGVPESRWFLA